MKTKTHFQQQVFLKPFLPFSFLFLICCFSSFRTNGQSYDSLVNLQGHQAQVYYSKGALAKAKRMAAQTDAVMQFYQGLTGFTPAVVLLVLSPEDWSTYSQTPVYGMPHYTDSKTLVVAAANNDFWKSFIPPLEKLPAGLATRISATYADPKGGLTMEPFFDLLAIHELGHAYHKQAGLQIQRKWMGELFVNIFLHTYIAEKEPRLLPALTLFPNMVVTVTDRHKLKYTSLQDLEQLYDEITRQYPQNYGWYQCRWHMEAGSIYDAGALSVFNKLWEFLKEQQLVVDDNSLTDLLNRKVHARVAAVIQQWDKE